MQFNLILKFPLENYLVSQKKKKKKLWKETSFDYYKAKKKDVDRCIYMYH